MIDRRYSYKALPRLLPNRPLRSYNLSSTLQLRNLEEVAPVSWKFHWEHQLLIGDQKVERRSAEIQFPLHWQLWIEQKQSKLDLFLTLVLLATKHRFNRRVVQIPNGPVEKQCVLPPLLAGMRCISFCHAEGS